MITIEDIRKDMKAFNENDAYYYDSVNDNAYHAHLGNNDRFLFMKNNGKTIARISEEDFVEAVNHKCYGNSISSDAYFETLKA